jgi:glycine cleavage system aminomethyltransferase T
MLENVHQGVSTFLNAGGLYIAPLEYQGYREEILASKTSAWVGTPLNESPIYDVEGPDAARFLTSLCVNNFMKMKVGSIRHAIMCNDKGQMLTDGVVMKIAENHFRTYWLMPIVDFHMSTTDMDVKGTDLSGTEFFIQVAGPRSLEILEQASASDLHDIKFAAHRTVIFSGVEVRVLRLGMAGSLAYELHGPMGQLDAVFKSIWDVAEPLGASKLGRMAYLLNHTEGGFANIFIHFPMPWFEERNLAEYCLTQPMALFFNYNRQLVGSMGDELESRFKTPYDVGWGSLVRFDHDFPGRAALERIADNPPNTMVTLEWNADDVGEIVASQYRGRDAVAYEPIDDRPSDNYFVNPNGFHYHSDKVMFEGTTIGSSTGRIRSVYYKRMISLGFIQCEHAVEGKQLTLLWGKPGGPQKEVRVTVARTPYMDLANNKDIDVNTIPRLLAQEDAGATIS